MTENQITIKGTVTNYKVIGEGSPMVILHGWPSSSEKWQHIAELLSQKNIKLFIPDLPGFGKSQELQTPWSLDNYVEWLSEFAQKIPELSGRFFLLGHSFGGALAAKFSIKYNQKVEKLFLISAACIRERTTAKRFFYRISKLVKIFSFLPFYQKARKGFYKYIIKRSDYIYQDGIMKQTYLKVILDDLSYKLYFVKVPTVIIWGDKDESTPLAQAQYIHKKIPNSKLVVIPSADHSLHLKMPEVLAEKILENI